MKLVFFQSRSIGVSEELKQDEGAETAGLLLKKFQRSQPSLRSICSSLHMLSNCSRSLGVLI